MDDIASIIENYFHSGSEEKINEGIKLLAEKHPLTEKLDLSSSEAEKFWPIYNAFDKAQLKLRHEKLRAIKNELKDQIDTITDEVALMKLNELLAAEAELNALKQTFHVKLKNVISSKKILLLKISEEGFNRQMMKRLRNRHKDQKH